jgi:hypothetical protein
MFFMDTDLVVLNINDLRALFAGAAAATTFADGRPVTLTLSTDLDPEIKEAAREVFSSR